MDRSLFSTSPYRRRFCSLTFFSSPSKWPLFLDILPLPYSTSCCATTVPSTVTESFPSLSLTMDSLLACLQGTE